jgi:hypothetical protein
MSTCIPPGPTSTTQINAAKSEARIDGASFVDEFGCALDPASTDWDAEAYAVYCQDRGIEGADKNALWPLYQAELVAATQYLAEGHELLVTTAGTEHNLT